MSFLKNLFTEKNQSQILENFLQEFFNSCGLALYFDIEEQEENRFKVDLFGKDEELLINQDGKLLKAIQIYFSLVMNSRNKKQEDKNPIYIKVDSLDFLAQHDREIMNTAQRLKKEVIQKKRSIVLREYLNSYQRRQIHQELTKDGKVKTSSIGEGSLKKIRISPNSGDQGDNFNF